MFRQKLQKFFIGRNGQDQFGLALMIFAIIIAFINHWIFGVISWGLLVFAIFRILSKNLVRRRKENAAFLKVWNKVKTPFISWKTKYNQRKFYKIYRCPKCRQKLRVPKYKGKVKVRCTKCGEVFIRKT